MLQKMIQISKWARIHVWQARLLTFVCYTLLFGIHYSCGRVLQYRIFTIPEVWVYASFCVGIVAYIFYELLYRNMVIQKRFAFQKFSCLTILFVSFFGLFVLFNQPAGTFPLLQNNVYAALPVKDAPAKADVLAPRSAEVKSTSELALGWQIALIALVIIGAIVLELALALLACEIACAGNGLLAIGVFVFGTGGVVFLTVYLIRQILGRGRKRSRRRH